MVSNRGLPKILENIINPVNDCADFEKSYVSNNAYHLMLKGETAELNIAMSYISFEQAELNLHEVVDKTFKEVMSDGEQAWEQYLSKIELDPQQMKILSGHFIRVCTERQLSRILPMNMTKRK